MAYSRTTWVSGETPLSAGNMNNIEDGIEELNSNVVVGPTGQATNITLSNNRFTASKSGWACIRATTDQNANPAPLLEAADKNGNIITAAWGITTSGASLRVSFPVKTGLEYRVVFTRCSFHSGQLFS